ncbi:GDSL-type esterase/lipase family protein [Streptomyces sp. NPDC092952]|uniref:GDSL-type esterase/lipase family protein n=1 Tax=Streptomyces sp. NPDC092952 TaxID=3366018 RepID=UPI00380D5E33
MTGELREIPLMGGPVRFRGALDVERTGAGVLPWRLPTSARAQFPDESVERMATLPSGVRLAFVTTATVLEVEALTTVTRYEGAAGPSGPGALELVVDGALLRREPLSVGNVLHVSAGRGTTVPGPTCRVTFGQLPPGEKEIELWLPQQSRIELVCLRADAEVVPPPATGRRNWLHHGSSVSHFPEADSPADTWPVIAAALGGVELVNLSLAGNALLDPFVARAIRNEPADLISLKLGLNVVTGASFGRRAFGPAVHGFLDTIREGHPDTPLLVVSPVVCPPVEDTPGPVTRTAEGYFTALGTPAAVPGGALTLNVVREELARVVTARQAHDPHLHHLDGRELFGADDIPDLPDGLHPDTAGHRRIAERFAAFAFTHPGPFA